MEIWKTVPGFEGAYEVSDQGRVRSLERKVRGVCHFTGEDFQRTVPPRILKPGGKKLDGHVSVVLGRKAGSKMVHQLVLLAFVGSAPQGKEVLHKNGNPKDNRLCNLHYGTRTENIIDAYNHGARQRKLSDDNVRQIRRAFSEGAKGKDIAQQFSVSTSVVSKIKLGQVYRWVL